MRNDKGLYVQDTHTHCHGIGRCTADKSYGREKSSHLANYDGGDSGTARAQKRRRVGHRERALRNNDNDAWFIYYLGSMARTGQAAHGLPAVTHLPPIGFQW